MENLGEIICCQCLAEDTRNGGYLHGIPLDCLDTKSDILHMFPVGGEGVGLFVGQLDANRCGQALMSRCSSNLVTQSLVVDPLVCSMLVDQQDSAFARLRHDVCLMYLTDDSECGQPFESVRGVVRR